MIPEVSIIIPIYNKFKYLDDLKKCLARQSFTNFECILIDDGSLDGSGKVCDEICKNDYRFFVYHLKNGGVSNARNEGLKHARGRYITFIDADDTFHEDYIRNLVACMKYEGVRFVISSSKKVWSDSNQQIPIEVPFDGYVEMDEILPVFMKHQLQNGIYGYCWGKMMDAELVKSKCFNTDLKLAEDLSFYLSIYPELEGIYFDNHQYYYYLQDAINSSMLKPDWEIDYFLQLKILLQMKSFLEEKQYLKDENLKLLTSRIYDYVFFTIYFAPKCDILSTCDEIRKLAINVKDTADSRRVRQRIVLGLFYLKQDKLLSRILCVFRKLKKVNY